MSTFAQNGNKGTSKFGGGLHHSRLAGDHVLLSSRAVSVLLIHWASQQVSLKLFGG